MKINKKETEIDKNNKLTALVKHVKVAAANLLSNDSERSISNSKYNSK